MPNTTLSSPEKLCIKMGRDVSHLISSHLSFNREGRWGTTDDFATSFLHSSLFSTALWDLANSRPVHSLMLSVRLFRVSHFSVSLLREDKINIRQCPGTTASERTS